MIKEVCDNCESCKNNKGNNKINKKNKKAQVTIFIIVAILIVAFAVLMFFVYPSIRSPSVSSTPTGFIQNCLQEELKDISKEISLNGGSANPSLYFAYQGDKIEYLCYTNEYFKKCVVQQPMLKQNMEQEIKKQISQKVDSCFSDLKKDYENKGYKFSLTKNDFEVIIEPKRINLEINYPLTISKESSNKYNKFNVIVNSNLYNLILISKRVIDWEARYGNADITSYMNYYPWLRAEKIIMSEGTKIYILTDKDSGEKLQFVSRSMVISPG